MEEPFVVEIDDNDEKEAEEMAIDLWYWLLSTVTRNVFKVWRHNSALRSSAPEAFRPEWALAFAFHGTASCAKANRVVDMSGHNNVLPKTDNEKIHKITIWVFWILTS